MSKTALDTLKGWFTTGKFPTQAQFWDMFDSFRHKDDPIEITPSFQAALDEKADQEAFAGHIAGTSYPHVINKEMIGLGNVDNTADADKPMSTAQEEALALAFSTLDMTGFEPKRSDDDNYVTDAEKTVLTNTSGSNSGDQDLSGLVSSATITVIVALTQVEYDAIITPGPTVLYFIK